jgi:hypothetical protein
MKNLILACALALSSPFMLPVNDAEAYYEYREWDFRIERLRATFHTSMGLPWVRPPPIVAMDAGSPLRDVCVVGDSIWAVNGTLTPGPTELRSVIDNLPPDSYVTFTIRSGGPSDGMYERTARVP